MKNKLQVCLLTGSLLSLLNIHAHAASSELLLNNASGLGNAFSGEAAIADDASTLYFNPAGLTRFNHSQFIIGDVEGRFNGTYTGSDNFAIPPFISIPQSGFVDGQATVAPYPFIYYSRPLSDKLAFGFGMMTPYGIGVGIPDTSIVRYAGTRLIMYVVDFSPAVAYKINDKLSVGLALDFQRMAFTDVAMFPGSTFGAPDSRIRNDATGWGAGWHGGVLYDLNDKTRVGLAYHSQSTFHPTGQSEFVVTPGVNVGQEIISNDFKFKTTLPPTTSLSLYRDVTPQWALMGTVDYAQWSDVKQTIYYNLAAATPIGAPIQVNSTVSQYYRNTVRVALGTNFKVTPKVMLRCGIAYETDPTNSTYRSITDPGTASTSLAAGAHVQAFKAVGFDIGYQHFFMNDSSIHTVSGFNTENGKLTLQRDALGVQATWDLA